MMSAPSPSSSTTCTATSPASRCATSWTSAGGTEARPPCIGLALAEEALLHSLESPGDSRAAVGLGLLHSNLAVSGLRGWLGQATGTARVDVALSLWRIERYAPALDHLLDTLLRDPDWTARLDAAIALREMPGERVQRALWRALDDPEGLVRHHALVSLLAMQGIEEPSEVESNPCIGIMQDDEATRLDAKRELARMLGLPEGGPPESGRG